MPSSQVSASPSTASSSVPGWGIIAGDGYLYASDLSSEVTGHYVLVPWEPPSDLNCYWMGATTQRQKLSVLRVGTSGDSYETQMTDAEKSWSSDYSGTRTSGTTLMTGSLITNADQGTLATYEKDTCSGDCSSPTQSFYLATTSGGGLASNSQVAMVAEQTSSVQPILQRADGSYVGTVSSTAGNFMIGFTATGGTMFTVANETPQIATADGGVIGASGATYDQSGNVTGQIANMPTHSWKGAYQIGTVEAMPPVLGNKTPAAVSSFAATSGGNFASKGTYVPTHTFGLIWCGTGVGEVNCGDGSNNVQYKYYRVKDQQPNAARSFRDTGTYVAFLHVAAHQAFDRAFGALPVMIQRGKEGAEFRAYVEDENDAAGNSHGDYADVYYFGAMENAQLAVGFYDGCQKSACDFSPQLTDTGAMMRLLSAIGTQIGNAAAHESGHYLTGKSVGGKPLPLMDCGLGNQGGFGKPEQRPCDDGDNFVYEFYNGGSGYPQDPTNDASPGGQFFFIDVPGHPIHWGRRDWCWIKDWATGVCDPACKP